MRFLWEVARIMILRKYLKWRGKEKFNTAALVTKISMLQVDDLEFDFFSAISESGIASPWKFNCVMLLNSAVERGKIFHIALESSIDHQAALSQAGDEEFLSIQCEQHKNVIYVATNDGKILGSLPPKGPLFDAIKNGMIPAIVELAWIKEPYKRSDLYTAFVIVSCINSDDYFEIEKFIELNLNDRLSRYKIIPLGDANTYIKSIRSSRIGEVVKLHRNHPPLSDKNLILIKRLNGEIIGSIPEEHETYKSICEFGRNYKAKIVRIDNISKSDAMVYISLAGCEEDPRKRNITFRP